MEHFVFTPSEQSFVYSIWVAVTDTSKTNNLQTKPNKKTQIFLLVEHLSSKEMA